VSYVESSATSTLSAPIRRTHELRVCGSLSGEKPGQTLQATDLVHEVSLPLVDANWTRD
jgi:hypothetical protein